MASSQILITDGNETQMADEHQHTHDHDHEHDEDEVIILEDENGQEHQFVLGEVLTVEGKDYAVLLPIDDETEEGVIFRVDGEEGDQMVLAEIDNDDEWQKVVDAYNDDLFDEEEEDDDENA
ncbi:DUF1292 domain-containing protein [Alicyclobacillus fastidiosus]|uniref:DUF1292 domain-containing protein n=1 Tax=Alicyclobacillus fastidiosus TaxID=392011 RepID=A0ABY6ZDZ1_9BACL|nr:DUF1292 domain-containing protein [Alicyclobacillus fastidiosus]WAH40461.1 DUF1292 domain-containing protein [Alicyclobacillus fastidiosus]